MLLLRIKADKLSLRVMSIESKDLFKMQKVPAMAAAGSFGKIASCE